MPGKLWRPQKYVDIGRRTPVAIPGEGDWQCGLWTNPTHNSMASRITCSRDSELCPKVGKIMAFWAFSGGFGLRFYTLLWGPGRYPPEVVGSCATCTRSTKCALKCSALCGGPLRRAREISEPYLGIHQFWRPDHQLITA